MVLLLIPVIVYGVWYNWKEKQKLLKRKQNRYREDVGTPTRRGAEPLVTPVVRKKEQVAPISTPILSTPASVTNVAIDPTDTTWFICTHKDLPAPSSAEALIIEQLDVYNVEWHREVSFKGIQLTPYSWPRYDFYLPGINTVIEYDGRSAHSNELQIATDKAKDKFCNDNGIKIVRYNAAHYYHMYGHINSLMKQSGIKKKNLQ